MKKVIFAVLGLGLLVTGPAMACDNGDCTPAPTPCVSNCNGAALERGYFEIKSFGTSAAYGKDVEVYNMAQHTLTMTIGDENNGVKFNAVGGFATQDYGTGAMDVSGKADNWGQYSKFTQW